MIITLKSITFSHQKIPLQKSREENSDTYNQQRAYIQNISRAPVDQ